MFSSTWTHLFSIDRILATVSTVLLYLLKPASVHAAQSDQIIVVIKNLTQDIYGDFVYLSAGFMVVVCIYHLILIVFTSSNDRSRSVHVKAIISAVGAWLLINVFVYFIHKILSITGQNTPADIFNTGGY